MRRESEQGRQETIKEGRNRRIGTDTRGIEIGVLT